MAEDALLNALMRDYVPQPSNGLTTADVLADPMLRNVRGSRPFPTLPPLAGPEMRAYNPLAGRPTDAMAPVAEALSPTMGAYGMGNLLGDTYLKGREGNWGGLEYPALAAMALPIPGAKSVRIQNPIRAYHGSPHDFSEFRMDKIGTGEGAQVYGHGLYFAESEPVARSYRNALTKTNAKFATPEWVAQTALDVHGGDFAKARAETAASLARFERIVAKNPDMSENFRADIDRYRAALDVIDNRGANPPGRMYEVALHATPESFLDWDKPLYKQSDAVQSVLIPPLEAKAINPRRPARAHTAGYAYKQASGLWDDLPDQVSGSQRLNKALQDAGILGIRYLDQGSRGAGQGTSNYVVFDPSIIEILRKYGIAGPAALGAMNALSPTDQQ